MPARGGSAVVCSTAQPRPPRETGLRLPAWSLAAVRSRGRAVAGRPRQHAMRKTNQQAGGSRTGKPPALPRGPKPANASSRADPAGIRIGSPLPTIALFMKPGKEPVIQRVERIRFFPLIAGNRGK